VKGSNIQRRKRGQEIAARNRGDRESRDRRRRDREEE
jgi:hypothetical protein